MTKERIYIKFADGFKPKIVGQTTLALVGDEDVDLLNKRYEVRSILPHYRKSKSGHGTPTRHQRSDGVYAFLRDDEWPNEALIEYRRCKVVEQAVKNPKSIVSV